MVVDPWGKVLCEMDGEKTGIETLTLDIETIQKVREKMPITQHRRL